MTADRGARCSDHPGAYYPGDDDDSWFAEPAPDAAAAAALRDDLAEAYRNRSKVAMAEYFEDWVADLGPISAEERLRLTAAERAAYSALVTVLRPDLTAADHFPSGHDPTTYQVVPNTLTVWCHDETKRPEWPAEEPWVSDALVIIDDFRPVVGPPCTRVVYLTPEREGAIRELLRAESPLLGGLGTEADEVIDFLAPFVSIVPGHWGGYWLVASQPEVHTVQLVEEMDRAAVAYRIESMGATALLERTADGGWEKVGDVSHWVE